MNQREFDRVVGVAAQRYLDLLRSQPTDKPADIAAKAWEQAEAFESVASKQDPGEFREGRESKRTKTTA
jgi:hypothetical protein